MAGSNDAGVSRVMSLRISSRVSPIASLAAIFAIGKPVAFDASAEERDTRGFISITTSRPSGGFPAQCVLGAAGLDADLADDRDGGVAHELVFLVGERLCGRDRDRVAGVDAHRVDVLDRADDADVVGEGAA